MSAQVFEIKHYMIIWRQMEVRSFDGVDVQIRGIVRCTGDIYTMDVVFYAPGSGVPQPYFEEGQNKGYMFMPVSDMFAFVDTVRNEKPIFGHLRSDRPDWMSVTTSQEPVGEGESK